MNEAYLKQIETAVQVIEQACGGAEIGVILGSGLGEYVEALEDAKSIAYQDIPGFPVSTAPGHEGRWYTGLLHGKRVCMMQGRFHSYEGYDQREVTLPVRVMKQLGVKTLIVTNAAGGVNLAFAPGDLMLMTDFINLSGKNPLIGANLDEFGPRFPDMSHAYDQSLQKLCEDVALRLGLHMQKGVYCWLNGPSYETPAEIRMVRILGGDAVGMSTVPETIVAKQSGMAVLGISCITNMAAGILDQALSHKEVMETGARVKDTFRALVDGVIHAL
ncbi:MAG: purine-nucleoside phosphorylase [Clostridia bacterium]